MAVRTAIWNQGSQHYFFSSEERHELGIALVEVARDVYSHTVQAVLSTEKIQYEKRIQEFTVLLADIEEHLQSLLKTADAEQEHPELAAEIRAQVKSFEYGLALLGPPHAYESMRQAQEHFSGRRAEKYMRA
jgi:NADH dehydrogenase/NADH:ubiquinone oxidoreductase subunit G